MQVIVFEAETSDAYWQGGKKVETEGSSIFPSRFSRLFFPTPPPPDMELGLAVPREIATLDIDEFEFDKGLLSNPKAKKKTFKKKNGIVDLSYQLELSPDPPTLKAKVKGTFRGAWFSQDDFSLKEDSTTLAAIRLRHNRGIFVAMTLFKTPPDKIESKGPPVDTYSAPRLKQRAQPEFPPELLGHDGVVVVQATVNRQGRIEPEGLRIVRAPHPLFARAFLSKLNEWVYDPGRKNGSPVEVVVRVTVNFVTR